MEKEALEEKTGFLMNKIGLNCKTCDANCCKINSYYYKNLNVIIDEETEARLLKKELETGTNFIDYMEFDVKNFTKKHTGGEEFYVVEKVRFDSNEESGFVGLKEDYPLKTENGILKIPKMNINELKNREYSTCIALNTKTNLCTIHNEKPLFCRLFPYYLTPEVRPTMYNGKSFTGRFQIELTPCNEYLAENFKNLTEYEKKNLIKIVHQILEDKKDFLARLTAFYELNQKIINNFPGSERLKFL